MLNKYFITPKMIRSQSYYDSQSTEYSSYYKENNTTYSGYNYLRPGFSSWLKKRHFELALKMTRRYFHQCNVIDFGCADGAFLPSLSKYFNNVVAIDYDPSFIGMASDLAKEHGLKNVRLICNHGMKMDILKQHLSGDRYHILFLLETLEHIGDRETMYEQKAALLRSLSGMIGRDGFMVVSVPKMVGPWYLLQRLGLSALGLYTEHISLKNLLKSSFLYDTDDLERSWINGHVGFNHLKLERCMREDFNILEKKDLLFQLIYIIKAKDNPGRDISNAAEGPK
jgi:2-polyprenyl-3-methyl-5-hydroxy-6-metoxy-1,4-benzoquinol methylase